MDALLEGANTCDFAQLGGRRVSFVRNLDYIRDGSVLYGRSCLFTGHVGGRLGRPGGAARGVKRPLEMRLQSITGSNAAACKSNQRLPPTANKHIIIILCLHLDTEIEIWNLIECQRREFLH